MNIKATREFVKIVLAVWAKYMEEVEHLRHVPLIRDTYKKRKETIERVFADTKDLGKLRGYVPKNFPQGKSATPYKIL